MVFFGLTLGVLGGRIVFNGILYCASAGICDITPLVDLVRFLALLHVSQAALEYEAQRFSEMAATPESESLIGLFEGSTALKKNRFGKPAKKVGVYCCGCVGVLLLSSCWAGTQRIGTRGRSTMTVDMNFRHEMENALGHSTCSWRCTCRYTTRVGK